MVSLDVRSVQCGIAQLRQSSGLFGGERRVSAWTHQLVRQFTTGGRCGASGDVVGADQGGAGRRTEHGGGICRPQLLFQWLLAENLSYEASSH